MVATFRCGSSGVPENGTAFIRPLPCTIGERETLIAAINASKQHRNASGARIKRMFTTASARDALARAYPYPANES